MEKVILSLKCSVKETKTNNRNKSENKINVESAKRKSKELSKVHLFIDVLRQYNLLLRKRQHTLQGAKCIHVLGIMYLFQLVTAIISKAHKGTEYRVYYALS